MSLYKARIKEFDELLNENVIDIRKLRRLCFNGIPDCNGYRALCWKILLGYLGLKKQDWPSILQKKRQLYKQFITEMAIPPGNDNSISTDHPLSDGPESAWSTFFKDNEFLLQIDKDVRRLCPDISFFQQATEFPCEEIVRSNGIRRLHTRVTPSTLSSANVERKGLGLTKQINLITKSSNESYEAMEEGSEAHWEVVQRILFLYAKLNPGLGYVQGMNEIIGPIYYVLASDPNIENRQFAEADSFFCFTALMGEIRDFFLKTLDESESGIKKKMAQLSAMLKEKDAEVWHRLEQQNLYPQYYSFRWLTLILSQEFPLPDVVRVWDSIFSDENRFDFLVRVCCAMIILLRTQLLESDFATNVKLLQHFPETDINVVLQKAAVL